jgi:hypothetical protein
VTAHSVTHGVNRHARAAPLANALPPADRGAATC